MPSPDQGTRSLLWPAVGTVLFVLVFPGTVIVYVPFLLTHWRVEAPFFGWPVVRWLGVALILGGLPIFFDFLLRFVRQGRGTPAPIAPTERLVVTGSFHYVRNPGYIAVLALLFGQALLFGSTAMLIYGPVIGLIFHAFVLLYEEPTLRRQFGTEYEDYCRQVPRWIPRFRRLS